MERQGSIDATAIRDAYFGATPDTLLAALGLLAEQMPDSTIDFLRAFAQAPHYAALQEEWRMLRDYREAWAKAPYPPVFVTVDAAALPGPRAAHPPRARAGQGAAGRTGGFIEQRETVWQSCLRELAEETHCALPEARMRAALREVAVFDHPDRSQRGRTITHAHYFDLEGDPFPDVRADDDAAQVEWFPHHAAGRAGRGLFEDHFHMLDHFLGLTSEPAAG